MSRERKDRPVVPKLKVIKKPVERDEVATINYHSSFSSANIDRELQETTSTIESNRDQFV